MSSGLLTAAAVEGRRAVLMLAVIAAGIWPAERAARVQPTEALRHE